MSDEFMVVVTETQEAGYVVGVSRVGADIGDGVTFQGDTLEDTCEMANSLGRILRCEVTFHLDGQ